MFQRRTSAKQAPRYCPDCKAQVDGGGASSLCAECGSTLVVEGYCPVCERYLPLPADAICPKHDTVLETAPVDPAEPREAGELASWLTVQVFSDSMKAALARSRLEAEGIPTFLDGERMARPGMYRVAVNGVKLQVPAHHAADARIILAQDWSLPGDENDDFEDLL